MAIVWTIFPSACVKCTIAHAPGNCWFVTWRSSVALGCLRPPQRRPMLFYATYYDKPVASLINTATVNCTCLIRKGCNLLYVKIRREWGERVNFSTGEWLHRKMAFFNNSEKKVGKNIFEGGTKEYPTSDTKHFLVYLTRKTFR